MISIKKLATVGAAASILAFSAAPALASDGSGAEIIQKNSDTTVTTTIDASSNSGSNQIKAIGTDGCGCSPSDASNSSIETGSATTTVKVKNNVNKNLVDASCGCLSDSSAEVIQKNKKTTVTTIVDDAKANSGKNKIKAIDGGNASGSEITSGNAKTKVSVKNVVNKNILKLSGGAE